jgi:hypothetical protein
MAEPTSDLPSKIEIDEYRRKFNQSARDTWLKRHPLLQELDAEDTGERFHKIARDQQAFLDRHPPRELLPVATRAERDKLTGHLGFLPGEQERAERMSMDDVLNAVREAGVAQDAAREEGMTLAEVMQRAEYEQEGRPEGTAHVSAPERETYFTPAETMRQVGDEPGELQTDKEYRRDLEQRGALPEQRRKLPEMDETIKRER